MFACMRKERTISRCNRAPIKIFGLYTFLFYCWTRHAKLVWRAAYARQIDLCKCLLYELSVEQEKSHSHAVLEYRSDSSSSRLINSSFFKTQLQSAMNRLYENRQLGDQADLSYDICAWLVFVEIGFEQIDCKMLLCVLWLDSHETHITFLFVNSTLWTRIQRTNGFQHVRHSRCIDSCFSTFFRSSPSKYRKSMLNSFNPNIWATGLRITSSALTETSVNWKVKI